MSSSFTTAVALPHMSTWASCDPNICLTLRHNKSLQFGVLHHLVFHQNSKASGGHYNKRICVFHVRWSYKMFKFWQNLILTKFLFYENKSKLSSGFICWKSRKARKNSHTQRTYVHKINALFFCFNPFFIFTSHTHKFSCNEKQRWSSERFVSEMKTF